MRSDELECRGTGLSRLREETVAMNVLFAVGVGSLGLALGATLLVLFGLVPRPWGPLRGTPFCGHPFEQTWGTGVKEWTCPKCGSDFRVDPKSRKWVPA